ncbi:hypothetical protein QJS04_geneDACA007419 [Acorus gramineus]|uniref:Uncharacterized protein n=1 Tax=Acorus gramineus TaxID=55184 RepID=A0AAV9B576_ACOGR|nr:hypothetical protein QJS04_geneDACA007419 [Acorus gramineus]
MFESPMDPEFGLLNGMGTEASELFMNMEGEFPMTTLLISRSMIFLRRRIPQGNAACH